jgi:hypothetical protein
MITSSAAMIELSQIQRSILSKYVADARLHSRKCSHDLEVLLEFVMSNMDVRKLDQLTKLADRELLRAVFHVMKVWYLLDNMLLTPSEAFDTIATLQIRVNELVVTEFNFTRCDSSHDTALGSHQSIV